MLSKLLDFTDTQHDEKSIKIGNTRYILGDLKTPENQPVISNVQASWFISAWMPSPTRRDIPQEIVLPFQWGICGDILVLYVPWARQLTDLSLTPLDGIYYPGTDNRICNRLLASELIK